jgi:hypothetical protein
VNRRHRGRYPRDILDGLFEEAAHHCAQLMDIASDLRRRNGDCTLDEVLVVVEIRTRDYAIDHSVSERHKRFMSGVSSWQFQVEHSKLSVEI